ncbi:MAG: MGMT family protein [Candidatus Yanofskybacteria bacterium]|nr:MGMT family protein [Candidatus Yanofskybacteria bacterium]
MTEFQQKACPVANSELDSKLRELLARGEISEFCFRVYSFVRTIPKGETVTYKEVAVAVGRPMAYRAVGSALNKNPFAPIVPCHRVICSNGKVGGFNEGTCKKIELLKRESLK